MLRSLCPAVCRAGRHASTSYAPKRIPPTPRVSPPRIVIPHRFASSSSTNSYSTAFVKPPPARVLLYAAHDGSLQQASSLDALLDHREDLDAAIAELCHDPDGDVDSDGVKRKAPHRAWWLHVQEPSKAEFERLASVLHLHPLTTEDMVAWEDRDKINTLDRYQFISYTSLLCAKHLSDRHVLSCMYIVQFPQGLLSIAQHADARHASNVVTRASSAKGRAKTGAAAVEWLSYALIDDVTDMLQASVHSAGRALERLDDKPMDQRTAHRLGGKLATLDGIHAGVVVLQRLLIGKGDVIKSLARRHKPETTGRNELTLHYSDVDDHLSTALRDARELENQLSREQGQHLLRLQVEMMDENRRTSDALTTLTILGTILVPLNVITGLWGMNVNVPGQEAEGLFMFKAIATSMLVITLISASFSFWFVRFATRRRREMRKAASRGAR